MAQAVSPKQATKETIIVSAPDTDVSKWKKYATTYYKRSLKQTSQPQTKQRNREEYLEYRTLLETAGITVTEKEGTLRFSNS